jgi:hypothetical protein
VNYTAQYIVGFLTCIKTLIYQNIDKVSKCLYLIRNRKLCDGSTNPDLEPKCGRPLGLKFNTATCDLYIADAYFGLLMVGSSGGVAKQLATSAQGVPFRFTNALDIDNNTGEVYFTDSSILFQRRYTFCSYDVCLWFFSV